MDPGGGLYDGEDSRSTTATTISKKVKLIHYALRRVPIHRIVITLIIVNPKEKTQREGFMDGGHSWWGFSSLYS